MEPYTWSYWTQAVGLNFNPSNDPDVQEIKELYAKIIDKMNDLRAKTENSEQKRLCSVAITEAQWAQMRAVKAQTWDK